MGYLVNDSFIIRRRFVIEQLEVQFMDAGQPYTLVSTNNSFFAIPVFCSGHSRDNVAVTRLNDCEYRVGSISRVGDLQVMFPTVHLLISVLFFRFFI